MVQVDLKETVQMNSLISSTFQPEQAKYQLEQASGSFLLQR